MNLLAIDPGTSQSAYVLWATIGREIIDKGILLNDAMLGYVQNNSFDHLAIEMIASYGMPVGKEVFETCVWIGRFIQASGGNNYSLIYRKDVKLCLCNSTKAKDSNIRQALLDMLGKEATKGVSKDIWAALGVAVTFTGMGND